MVLFSHKLAEKCLFFCLLISHVHITLVLFSLANAMLELPHHACFVFIAFLECILKKNGIICPRTCQEMSLFALLIMLLVLSLHHWHDIMMGPSFKPLPSNIDIKCLKLICC